MKKVLLTVFLISLFNTTGFTQSNYSVGLNLGLNYTSFRGSDVLDNTNSGFGHLEGLFVEYRIDKRFAINTGLNLDSKSIKYETNYTYTYFDQQKFEVVNERWDVKTTNRYKYLTIPLLLKYSFGKSKCFFVNGGGFISFWQNHTKKSRAINDKGVVIDNYSSSSGNNFPLADDVSSDYGLSFGLGKLFKLDNRNTISVELRDNLGLCNTIEGTFVQGVSGVIKTNSLSLIASWSFCL
ncbi:PorT family protein [Flavobacterium sufflavum]|uniref:PorT family protein n=1 Tax=Flavobacterium sufflavum TaxID=1921138 RepID=A0A3S2XJ82_9FLAO|nr:outer membrane beta-barrel protein [Flavobacterium sufflavum]RVT77325.1 PorT family protein [Flavobacterium sufflavum]